MNLGKCCKSVVKGIIINATYLEQKTAAHCRSQGEGSRGAA